MNLPGFTAELSLRAKAASYRPQAQPAANQTFGSGVVASFKGANTLNCGPCMELKFPNGKGTGVCYKYCCDSTGNCELKDCTCATGDRGPLR